MVVVGVGEEMVGLVIEELEKLMGWVGNGLNFLVLGILEGWGIFFVGFKGVVCLWVFVVFFIFEMFVVFVFCLLLSLLILDFLGFLFCCLGFMVFCVGVEGEFWLLFYYSGV